MPPLAALLLPLLLPLPLLVLLALPSPLLHQCLLGGWFRVVCPLLLPAAALYWPRALLLPLLVLVGLLACLHVYFFFFFAFPPTPSLLLDACHHRCSTLGTPPHLWTKMKTLQSRGRLPCIE